MRSKTLLMRSMTEQLYLFEDSADADKEETADVATDTETETTEEAAE